MKTKVKLGLIGYGYWGPNLLRNMVSNPNCEIIGVVDSQAKNLEKCKKNYPHLPVFESVDLFLKQKPDGVLIATPPSTHASLAIQCLNANAHVLVEKPLGLSVKDCDEILKAAKTNKRIVMVDHTYTYTPAVQYLAKEVADEKIGNLLYYDSIRVNLGGFQPETNVLWDLAPHDLSILERLTNGQTPIQVNATGVKHFGSQIENMCYANLIYRNNMIAHLHLNWAAPVKVRQIMIGGSKSMVIFDDNHPVEKVRIYNSGVSVNQTADDFRINYRVGDMVAPALPQKEALAEVIADFILSIETGKEPLMNGEAGRRVVQILEALSKSMAMGGVPVELSAISKKFSDKKSAA